MLPLQPYHIIALFCWVDDSIPHQSHPFGGRPTSFRDSEVITIMLWATLVGSDRTLKDIYQFTTLYHQQDFPLLPRYSTFVYRCHKAVPLLITLLTALLCDDTALRFMDSTMIEVCKLIRADYHKVARGIAAFGKNHQGWHYGFKLHASIDTRGRLAGIALTPANVFDAHMMPRILNKYTRIAVGDSSYGASVMARKIFQAYGTIIITYPHYKQRTEVMGEWQHLLLTLRPKIESVFDYLKQHLGLVSSFPRSTTGYLLHYLRILLGYQLLVS